MLIDTGGLVEATLKTLQRQLSELIVSSASVNRKLGVIMSEDAAVEAVVTDIQAQVSNLTGVMQSVSATVGTLLSEAQASGGQISAQSLTDLQNAQAQLDAAVTAAQTQAASEASSVPQSPAPPVS